MPPSTAALQPLGVDRDAQGHQGPPLLDVADPRSVELGVRLDDQAGREDHIAAEVAGLEAESGMVALSVQESTAAAVVRRRTPASLPSSGVFEPHPHHRPISQNAHRRITAAGGKGRITASPALRDKRSTGWGWGRPSRRVAGGTAGGEREKERPAPAGAGRPPRAFLPDNIQAAETIGPPHRRVVFRSGIAIKLDVRDHPRKDLPDVFSAAEDQDGGARRA